MIHKSGNKVHSTVFVLNKRLIIASQSFVWKLVMKLINWWCNGTSRHSLRVVIAKTDSNSLRPRISTTYYTLSLCLKICALNAMSLSGQDRKGCSVPVVGNGSTERAILALPKLFTENPFVQDTALTGAVRFARLLDWRLKIAWKTLFLSRKVPEKKMFQKVSKQFINRDYTTYSY